MLDSLMALIAPHVCVVCGGEGDLLCSWCRYASVEALPPRCYRCYALSVDSRTCAACRRKTALEHVWVRSQYIGAAHDLVYALKFSRARAAAARIAGLLDEALPYLPEGTIVTYVPTATGRIRLRGYDQTRLIAREFARIRGMQCRKLLIRIGQARQVGSSRDQRTYQAANNYTPVSDVLHIDMVLLIDDILTTGATLESAATVLRSCGVKHVFGAVFAQKQ